MRENYTEGFWEDILKQASQFRGKRVRVTLLDTEKKKAEPKPKKVKAVDEKTARFIKELAGSWKGDDLNECLEAAIQSRSKTKW